MSFLDIALLAAAYLIGAVPFGLLVAKAFGGQDLRNQGSGNIGATNAARVLGKKAGAVTLLADVLKGYLAVFLARHLSVSFLAMHLTVSPEIELGAAAAAVIGHVFPVYLGFRGGKGVATGFGVLMALSFPTALAAFVIWVAAYAVSRISAVGALAAYGSLPVVAWWLGPEGLFFAFACALGALVIATHRSNIRLLISDMRG